MALTKYGYHGPTKTQERAALKRGGVWIAQSGDWSYDAIAVAKTKTEARALCLAAVRELNPFVDMDDEGVLSGISVRLLAPGEATT
jgi:hypothetical protein